MDSFPAFIPLQGAKIVLVGDGDAAEAKARLLAGSPAELIRAGPERALEAGLYDGARLVFLVLDGDVSVAAAALARAAGALVNVVDRPKLSDFFTPAIVDRSPVLAAIGTGGAAPVFATQLRSEIETRWPEGLGRLASLSAELQQSVREALPDLPARRDFWRRFLSGNAAVAALKGDLEEARRLALAELAAGRREGRVWILAAPPRAELLSLAAVRALAAADRIVAGEDAAPDTLAFARRDALRSTAATPDQLAAWAQAGESVLVISAEADARDVAALGVAVERLPVAGS